MKLTINQNGELQETEIIINCSELDQRIRNLADYIRQYSTSLEGVIDSTSYYVSLDSILYIDSVEKRTFFYDQHRIYSTAYTLAELEKKLRNTSFVRISKNCIVNLAYVHSSTPIENHRLELAMVNGERQIVTRSYKENFTDRFRAFRADAFHISAFTARELFEHDLERSIYNAGEILRFPVSPKRVVALSYENAELLAALGVADRLVAVAPAECSFEQILPQYRTELKNIPVLRDHDQGVPTLAELRELEPDLVLGKHYSILTLERDAAAKVKDYNISLYVMEGTVPDRATIESAYRDILNLGRIFHVESNSIRLVEQIRKRIATLTRWIDHRTSVRVFIFDSKSSMPYTAMGGTFENNLISIAGGQNVFGTNKEQYRMVTWEQIADAAPEVIVVNSYIDYLSTEEKIQTLKSRKELCDVPAIKYNRFVELTFPEMFPGVQMDKAVEKLMRGFYPDLL